MDSEEWADVFVGLTCACVEPKEFLSTRKCQIFNCGFFVRGNYVEAVIVMAIGSRVRYF